MANSFKSKLWLISILPKLYEDESKYGQGLTKYEIRKKYLEANDKDLPDSTLSKYISEIKKDFGIKIEYYIYPQNTYNYYVEKKSYEYATDHDNLLEYLFNRMTIDNMLIDCRSINNRILLERSSIGFEKYFPEVLEAIKHNYVIHVKYQGYWVSEPEEFDLEPYWLKSFQQRWYVVGRRVDKNIIHNYSLEEDRMWSVEIDRERTFEMPKDEQGNEISGKDYYKDSFGIIRNDEKVEDVVLRVDGNQDKYIHSLPLHPSQEEDPKDGYTIFKYRMRITHDFMMKILSFAPYVIVIKPKKLVEIMGWRAEALDIRYNGEK